MAAYVKNPEWKDGEAGNTPITADKLNHLEEGVFQVSTLAESIKTIGNISKDNTVVASFWGDSRTEQNWSKSTTYPAPLARSWVWWFEALSQRIRMTYEMNFGKSGDSIDQLWARIRDDVANDSGVKPSQVPPGIATILIGTNSVNAGTPLADMLATLTLILDWFYNRGFKVMIVGEWPRGSDAANSGLLLPDNQKLMYAYAKAVRHLAGVRKNLWVADVWPYVADPAKLDARPLPDFLNDDDLHNSPGIGYTTGRELARIAEQEMSLPRMKKTTSQNGDVWDAVINKTGNLCTNPMFVKGTGGTLGLGATGEVPQGWTLATQTNSLLAVFGEFVTITLPNGTKRQAYRVTVTATGAGGINGAALNQYFSLRQSGLISKVSQNDLLEANYEVVVKEGHQNFSAPALMIDTGVAATRAYGGLSISQDHKMPASVTDSFYAVPQSTRLPLATVPATLSLELRPMFTLGGVVTTLTIDFLSCSFRKLV